MPTLEELNVQPGDRVEWVDGSQKYWDKPRIYTVREDGNLYHKDGGWIPREYNGNFRIISRASDAPKSWKDMTDEERAPILLAWARGEEIEWTYLQSPDTEWKVTFLSPNQWDGSAYRIKPKAEPEPERVERFFQVDYNSMAEAGDVSDARLMVKDYGGYIYRITTDPDGGNATIEAIE